MLRSDWKIMFASGIIYIFANWLGLVFEGEAMYPIADWTSYPLTIFLYFLMGCTHTYLYVLITDYINSKRSKECESGYDEGYHGDFIGGHHGGGFGTTNGNGCGHGCGGGETSALGGTENGFGDAGVVGNSMI